MTIQEFITTAIEGGYVNNYLNPRSVAEMQYLLAESKHMILLDPNAWKAVGKVKGWDTFEGSSKFPNIRQVWHVLMLEMIESLVEGKTLEEYIATL